MVVNKQRLLIIYKEGYGYASKKSFNNFADVFYNDEEIHKAGCRVRGYGKYKVSSVSYFWVIVRVRGYIIASVRIHSLDSLLCFIRSAFSEDEVRYFGKVDWWYSNRRYMDMIDSPYRRRYMKLSEPDMSSFILNIFHKDLKDAIPSNYEDIYYEKKEVVKKVHTSRVWL